MQSRAALTDTLSQHNTSLACTHGHALTVFHVPCSHMLAFRLDGTLEDVDTFGSHDDSDDSPPARTGNRTILVCATHLSRLCVASRPLRQGGKRAYQLWPTESVQAGTSDVVYGRAYRRIRTSNLRQCCEDSAKHVWHANTARKVNSAAKAKVLGTENLASTSNAVQSG